MINEKNSSKPVEVVMPLYVESNDKVVRIYSADAVNSITENRGVGTRYYVHKIIIWMILNLERIQQTIEFVDTLSTLADVIAEEVARNHCLSIGGDYISNTHYMYRSFVDDGCWTPDTPWNPFCKKENEENNESCGCKNQ